MPIGRNPFKLIYKLMLGHISEVESMASCISSKNAPLLPVALLPFFYPRYTTLVYLPSHIGLKRPQPHNETMPQHMRPMRPMRTGEVSCPLLPGPACEASSDAEPGPCKTGMGCMGVQNQQLNSPAESPSQRNGGLEMG